jgi:hypothetical protein
LRASRRQADQHIGRQGTGDAVSAEFADAVTGHQRRCRQAGLERFPHRQCRRHDQRLRDPVREQQRRIGQRDRQRHPAGRLHRPLRQQAGSVRIGAGQIKQLRVLCALPGTQDGQSLPHCRIAVRR